MCQIRSTFELPVDAIIATVKSWFVPYRGNISEVVYEYMQSHNDPDLYARMLAIVQSSGMGKSRMIDQLSKSHFVIPLNLREGESGRFTIRRISNSTALRSVLIGYPASDSCVRDWFKTPGYSPVQTDSRCCAFLTALFEKTLEIIRDPPNRILKAILESPDLTAEETTTARMDYPDNLPGQFRLFMTIGQKFSTQGDLRINFYDNVLKRADEASCQ